MTSPITRVYLPGNRMPIKRLEHAPFYVDGIACKFIPLSKGQFATVCESDYEWLSAMNWSALWCKGTRSYYARTNVKDENGKQRSDSMHRMIMGLYRNDPRKVDHVEPAETLDNRRSNLRIATHTENMRNRRANRNTKAGLKGVNWHERDKIFEASIRINGRLKYLGRDVDPLKCHALYCAAAAVEFGEFARAK